MIKPNLLWTCIGAVGILMIIIFHWPERSIDISEPITQPRSDEQSETKTPDFIPVLELTQETCESNAGTWNACGSACRTEPGAACIQVCVEYCECVSSDECPQGFVCGDFVANVGVCVPSES